MLNIYTYTSNFKKWMETISSNQNEDLSITDNLEERGKIYLGGRMEISWHLNAGHFWSTA